MELTLEAYRIIVNYAGSRSDIAALCRVSKTLHRAAEPALYNTIVLTNPHEALALSSTVIGSPRLAVLVVALTISLMGEEDASQEGGDESRGSVDTELPPLFWEGVAGALRRLRNLKFLTLNTQSASIPASAAILRDAPFSLEALHCDLDWDDDLVQFLNTQSDLHDLYILDFKQPATRSRTRTPSQTTHTTETSSSSPSSTTLDVSAMPHLTTLEYSSYSEPFAMDILRRVVNTKVTSSHLRYLGTLVLPIEGPERLQFYGLLMRLPALKCIEVEVSEWDPPPSTTAAYRALTNELRLYCRSITSVVFVLDFERTLVTVTNGVCSVNMDAGTDLLWRET